MQSLPPSSKPRIKSKPDMAVVIEISDPDPDSHATPRHRKRQNGSTHFYDIVDDSDKQPSLVMIDKPPRRGSVAAKGKAKAVGHECGLTAKMALYSDNDIKLEDLEDAPGPSRSGPSNSTGRVLSRFSHSSSSRPSSEARAVKVESSSTARRQSRLDKLWGGYRDEHISPFGQRKGNLPSSDLDSARYDPNEEFDQEATPVIRKLKRRLLLSSSDEEGVPLSPLRNRLKASPPTQSRLRSESVEPRPRRRLRFMDRDSVQREDASSRPVTTSPMRRKPRTKRKLVSQPNRILPLVSEDSDEPGSVSPVPSRSPKKASETTLETSSVVASQMGGAAVSEGKQPEVVASSDQPSEFYTAEQEPTSDSEHAQQEGETIEHEDRVPLDDDRAPSPPSLETVLDTPTSNQEADLAEQQYAPEAVSADPIPEVTMENRESDQDEQHDAPEATSTETAPDLTLADKATLTSSEVVNRHEEESVTQAEATKRPDVANGDQDEMGVEPTSQETQQPLLPSTTPIAAATDNSSQEGGPAIAPRTAEEHTMTVSPTEKGVEVCVPLASAAAEQQAEEHVEPEQEVIHQDNDHAPPASANQTTPSTTTAAYIAEQSEASVAPPQETDLAPSPSAEPAPSSPPVVDGLDQEAEQAGEPRSTLGQPSIEAVTTEVPPSEAPGAEAPITEAPATETPVIEAPVTEIPATKALSEEGEAAPAPLPSQVSEGEEGQVAEEKPEAIADALHTREDSTPQVDPETLPGQCTSPTGTLQDQPVPPMDTVQGQTLPPAANDSEPSAAEAPANPTDIDQSQPATLAPPLVSQSAAPIIPAPPPERTVSAPPVSATSTATAMLPSNPSSSHERSSTMPPQIQSDWAEPQILAFSRSLDTSMLIEDALVRFLTTRIPETDPLHAKMQELIASINSAASPSMAELAVLLKRSLPRGLRRETKLFFTTLSQVAREKGGIDSKPEKAEAVAAAMPSPSVSATPAPQPPVQATVTATQAAKGSGKTVSDAIEIDDDEEEEEEEGAIVRQIAKTEQVPSQPLPPTPIHDLLRQAAARFDLRPCKTDKRGVDLIRSLLPSPDHEPLLKRMIQSSSIDIGPPAPIYAVHALIKHQSASYKASDTMVPNWLNERITELRDQYNIRELMELNLAMPDVREGIKELRTKAIRMAAWPPLRPNTTPQPIPPPVTAVQIAALPSSHFPQAPPRQRSLTMPQQQPGNGQLALQMNVAQPHHNMHQSQPISPLPISAPLPQRPSTAQSSNVQSFGSALPQNPLNAQSSNPPTLRFQQISTVRPATAQPSQMQQSITCQPIYTTRIGPPQPTCVLAGHSVSYAEHILSSIPNAITNAAPISSNILLTVLDSCLRSITQSSHPDSLGSARLNVADHQRLIKARTIINSIVALVEELARYQSSARDGIRLGLAWSRVVGSWFDRTDISLTEMDVISERLTRKDKELEGHIGELTEIARAVPELVGVFVVGARYVLDRLKV